MPDVDDGTELSEVQANSLVDPASTEWLFEAELWLRRESELIGATHWKARYARLKGTLSCPFLIVYREGKWPSPVKQGAQYSAQRRFWISSVP